MEVQHGVQEAEAAPPAALRDQVRALAQAMRVVPGAITDASHLTSHHFCAGLYGRELFIPAGMAVVGKVHANENMFLLLRGRLQIATEAGPVEIAAPWLSITQPGQQRAVFALEDSVCMNIHANPDDERDMAVLESRYIIPEALPAPDTQERLT